MIDLQYSESSTLVKRGAKTGVDRYNRPIYGPSQRTDAECFWEPLSASEETEQAEQYITGYRIQWPATYYPQIKGSDSVELPIGEFQIKGKPLVHPAMGMLAGFVVATLEEVEG